MRVARYVTAALDVFSERVRRGFVQGWPAVAPSAAAGRHHIGWFNGVFDPEWLTAAFKYIAKHRWTTWIVCPDNREDLLPALRDLTDHIATFPVGTRAFVSNGDGYRSPPVPTRWRVFVAFVDFRPWDLKIEQPVLLPQCPTWAAPK